MSETIVLAGGGTGGHVFPLLAVAEALVRLRPSVELVFVGTARGMETRLVPERGFQLELLDVLPIRGNGLGGVVRGVARAAKLLPESKALLERRSAVGVLSVGGYAAGPVSAAARLLGLPLALLEPNSVIGLANWLVAPFVDRAYLAFERAEAHFSPSVVRALGVPLRSGFEPSPYRAPSGRALRVLVLGGSQGAKTLNEILPRALSRAEVPLDIVHQCGAAHASDVEARYSAEGAAPAEVVPFIEDMQGALARADLVVGRAGAGAVSEICAVGRPSLLVPYPYASGDHQRVNAESLEKRGAAICVPSREATEERLRAEVEGLARDPARLVTMAARARELGRPQAATHVARDFLDLLGLAESSASAPPEASAEVAPHRPSFTGALARGESR